MAWPVTDARIQNATVEFHRGNKGGGTYHAEVLYTFAAEGQPHSGNRVAFGDYGSSNPSHAQDIVNRYPTGAVVPVRYLPTEPDVCVLEPGVQGQTWFMPGFGLVFFLTGMLLAVFLPRALKKQEDAKPGTESGAMNGGQAADSEGTSRVKRTALHVCIVLAVLAALFLWQDGNLAALQQWWTHSTRSAPDGHTADGGGASSSAPTHALPPPQPQQTLPVVETQSIATNAPVELEAQPAAPTDISGDWHVTRAPSLDRKVTLMRVDDQHYKLTPANLALQGVYAWDGKTLSMESGNRGYRDLTWELTSSDQFTMVKGAYKGATMKREQ